MNAREIATLILMSKRVHALAFEANKRKRRGFLPLHGCKNPSELTWPENGR